MAQAKSFEINFQHEADLLKVLAHPIRLRIVHGLLDQSSNVKEIWTKLDMPQATVSQHLALLKSRGIVNGVRNGTKVTYSVSHPTVRELMGVLSPHEH